MRLPGTPPVFYFLTPDNHMNTSNHTQPTDDEPQDGRDRIDADPPYGPFPEQIKRFREFLAEMIARQILAERRGPKNSDNKIDP